jgi:hypothetical protein
MCQMKFEIKTKPVWVTIVTLAALAAIVTVQVHGTRYDFSEGWYTITVIVFVLVQSIDYITK